MSVRKGLCDLCGQSFTKLTDHIRDLHGDSCSSCDLCSKVFKSVKLRSDNLRSVFSRSKYFVKDVSSPYHKKKLKMGLNHYNSYNV